MKGAAWQRLDHLQPLLAGMLVALGLMTVYSAHADWVRQLVWVGLGGAAYAAATLFDYRRLRPLAPWLYFGMLALLLAVRLAGRTTLGAQRWLSIGGFPLQPSELSKLMLVVVLAAYLSRTDRLSWRAFLGALGLVAPVAALILIQPDLGTTIVVVAVLIGMLFLGGARIVQLGSLAACAALVVPLLPHLLHGYQRRRLEIFLNPTSDPLGAGYNLLQARIAVGAGGLFGQRWLHGLQGALGFVPERATQAVAVGGVGARPLRRAGGGRRIRHGLRPGRRERRYEHRAAADRRHPAAPHLVWRIGDRHDACGPWAGPVGDGPPPGADATASPVVR